jgi:hypothetical protein
VDHAHAHKSFPQPCDGTIGTAWQLTWWARRSPSCMIVLLPLFTTHVVAPRSVKTKGEYFPSTCSRITLICFSKGINRIYSKHLTNIFAPLEFQLVHSLPFQIMPGARSEVSLDNKVGRPGHWSAGRAE